jgi:LysM repeat protein
VHPTGLAIDLRVSSRTKCRTWLEGTLLSLERRGLAEATRERRPPHYHVVVFPTAYETFVATVTGVNASVTATSEATAAEAQQTAEYEVNRGDSLWLIARRFGTDVEQLKELNGISGNRILPGQTLRVPGERAAR